MDQQIQKLKKLVHQYLHKSRAEIRLLFGKPHQKSDNEIWFYTQYQRIIFKDEIAFIFEEDHVVDIVISQFILWKEWKNIFYYENQNPEYKIIYLL